MADGVVIPREQVVYVVPETTAGVLAAPSAGDALAVVGLGGVPNQAPEYTASEEVAASRSVLAWTRDRMPAGEWTLRTYSRPVAAGTPPAEAALWKALLGSETVNAGSSVVYQPAVAKPTVSLWWRGRDNTVLFARGATVSKMGLEATAKGYPTLEWSGGCMEAGWCGESALSSALSGGETTVSVDDPERFRPGARVKIGTSDNAGAGHEVTAVDTGAGTLTVTPAVSGAQSAGAAVVPVLPTPTYTGAPLEARDGALTLAGSGLKYKSFQLTVEDPTEWINDEVDASSEYPSAFVPGARQVTAEVRQVLRAYDLTRWREAVDGLAQALVWTCGAAGARIQVSLPKAVLSVPNVEEGSPAVEITWTARARAQTGEDEITVTFD